MNKCHQAILRLLRKRRYFNEMCRMLPTFSRREIARELIRLEQDKIVTSRLKQSTFGQVDEYPHLRWVREYRKRGEKMVKKKSIYVCPCGLQAWDKSTHPIDIWEYWVHDYERIVGTDDKEEMAAAEEQHGSNNPVGGLPKGAFILPFEL